jgi:hypothetical protein
MSDTVFNEVDYDLGSLVKYIWCAAHFPETRVWV